MPVSASFLASCRTALTASSEWAAFRAALAALEKAGPGTQMARWRDAYDDGKAAVAGGRSPATALRQLIRAVVVNVEASSGTALSQSDREGAYQTLQAEFVGTEQQAPALPDKELHELHTLAMTRLAGGIS